MNEIVAILLTLSAYVTNLPEPEKPPIIKEVSVQELQERTPGDTKDLYIFTDPSDNTIYVAEGINYDLTFAQAELFQEITRYTLAVNGIYNPKASCQQNAAIQAVLERIEFTYIKKHADHNKYLGFGVPEPEEMPKHVFFCNPDAEPVLKDELFV